MQYSVFATIVLQMPIQLKEWSSKINVLRFERGPIVDVGGVSRLAELGNDEFRSISLKSH